MYVDLTSNEMRTLIQVLDERLNALRHEIIHTSTHDYKAILRDRQRVLQCLHDKLVTCDALNVA
jgi:hypothetical protein